MDPLRKPFPSRGHNTAASYERGAPQLYPAMARMCLAFRKRQTSGSSTLGRSRCLAAARSSVRWRRIPLSISPSDFLSAQKVHPSAGRLLLFGSTADLQRSPTTMDAEVGEIFGRTPDGTLGATRDEDHGSAR